MDKVIGGTPRGTQSMCSTCRKAHRVVGVNFQELVLCMEVTPPIAIRFPVAECRRYDDQRVPALWQMQDIAWNIQSRNRGPVGFADTSRGLEIVITPPNENNRPQPPGAPAVAGRDPLRSVAADELHNPK